MSDKKPKKDVKPPLFNAIRDDHFCGTGHECPACMKLHIECILSDAIECHGIELAADYEMTNEEIAASLINVAMRFLDSDYEKARLILATDQLENSDDGTCH